MSSRERPQSPSDRPTKAPKTHDRVRVGDMIPAVTLVDETGTEHALGEIKGLLVLFSYPKASTPGCTRQTSKFGEMYPQFEEAGATVFGVSADSPKAQTTFKNKTNIGFHLLSDPNYELLGPLNAKKSPKGVIRSHWVFKDGECIYEENSVKPDTSAEITFGVVERSGGKPVKDEQGEQAIEQDGKQATEQSKDSNGKSESTSGGNDSESNECESCKSNQERDKPKVTAKVNGKDSEKVEANPEIAAKIASKVIAEVVTKAADVDIDPSDVALQEGSEGESKKLKEAKEDDEFYAQEPENGDKKGDKKEE